MVLEHDAPVGGGCQAAAPQECYYTKLKLLGGLAMSIWLGGLAMSIWEELLLEPRWLTLVGLCMDLFGGSLIAYTAWFRLSLFVVPLPIESRVSGVTGSAHEPEGGLKWRRHAVVWGGILLGLGFVLQICATWLQIP